jgi:hypothetical protein
MTTKTNRFHAVLIGMALFTLLYAAWALAPAGASAAGPRLGIYTSIPDSAMPGEKLNISFSVQNVGDTRVTGPITMSDTLSAGGKTPGLQPGFEQFITTTEAPYEIEEEERQPGSCVAEGLTLTCTVADAIPPGAELTMHLEAGIEPSASGTVTNTIAVHGGNAPSARSEYPITVGEPLPFGFANFGVDLLDGSGNQLTQAAADPADFTTTLRFRTVQGEYLESIPITASVGHFKNVVAHLPVGLVGNPTATPVRCTPAQLAEYAATGTRPNCPDDSQIGVVHVELAGSAEFAGLYNVEPPPGAAAELGFNVLGTVVALDAYLRPGDNGIDIVSRDTSTTVPITEAAVTVWGDPAAHSHDRERGACLGWQRGATGQVCPSTAPEEAFLRLPTSCSGIGLPFGAGSNSYEEPDVEATASIAGPVLNGCERVPFNPSIYVQPTTSAASSTSGVAVQLSLPQSSNPGGLAEADLKKAVVTLPEGMTLNPSSADGLQACTDAQLRLGLEGPSECPEASKIGRVELHTPLLENPIEGTIWLRTQNSSDPASGEMFRMALELRDDRHGIDIKLPGQVAANPMTGQLTSTFDDAPQLPFDDITLHFKSGARSPLSTPPSCGTKTTVAELYSWAEPNTPVQRTVPFQVTSGPEGGACASPRPFAPSFNAGVTSVQAGGYTPFLTTFARADAEQPMGEVSVHMPEGLLGSLTGIPLCPEAEANAGTCAAASQIGTVTAGAGVGPSPFYVTGGKVYVTGPYKGAPFGLSVVVPAKAGPFDLGTVVVRAKVAIDRRTAQLTVTTDPLPQIVGGVPVDLRLVNVTIDRPNFVFNPTSCAPMSVTGSVNGAEGASVPVANDFQVANCAALAFKPGFSAATQAKHSRKDGAKLQVTVTSHEGQAGIAKVHVELPKGLPSRLSTLQQACTEAQFEANPAGCPAASVVGSATVNTPVLPVPLTGPAYFVSHGSAKFPELILVLQGYGVTVELNGETFISKAGITSSTFKTVPDVPFSRFTLTLPRGPHSALAANGSLCGKHLSMPTMITGQNGAVLTKQTKIEVKGCVSTRKKGKAKRHKATRHGKR